MPKPTPLAELGWPSTQLVPMPLHQEAVIRKETSLPPRAGNGVHQLEERLSRQERTMALLLEQAAHIKDDLVSHLQGPRGEQQGDTAAQQLLQSHVQAVMGAVKQLCRDVEVLEMQIRTRDNATLESNFALQSLDRKYIQGFGDLRGRVARCEASIAKLAGDINTIKHEAHKTDKEIYGVRSALEKCVSDFEKKVMQLLGKIKTSSSDQSSNLKTVQGDPFQIPRQANPDAHRHHPLSASHVQLHPTLGTPSELHRVGHPTSSNEPISINTMLASTLNDFKAQIQTQQKWTEMQLSRYEQDQAYHRSQLLHSVKERLETAEKRLEEKILLLSLKLERANRSHKYEKQLDQMKNDEKALQARITMLERQVWNELEEVQREYRSGFQSIRESLELLRQIQNTKLKLEKKKIRKDMTNI
ncbi:PREDICTED: protein FAM81B [Tinamus guttatus]|uniref:protein FAM81B n=1 Tax=Tinamus guttatus TaxID=94827 RepID=UPI00052EB389|nr:PREDICTED: protein FAM81B [Tinamus guttatus]